LCMKRGNIQHAGSACHDESYENMFHVIAKICG
jgi:hypothetical protein